MHSWNSRTPNSLKLHPMNWKSKVSLAKPGQVALHGLQLLEHAVHLRLKYISHPGHGHSCPPSPSWGEEVLGSSAHWSKPLLTWPEPSKWILWHLNCMSWNNRQKPIGAKNHLRSRELLLILLLALLTSCVENIRRVHCLVSEKLHALQICKTVPLWFNIKGGFSL